MSVALSQNTQFKIHFRHNGALYYDTLSATDAEAAAKEFAKQSRANSWNVEFVKVEPIIRN